MLNRPTEAPAGLSAGPPERPLGPAFAWALGGAAAILALALLLYAAAVLVGAWSAGVPGQVPRHLASAPPYRELAGLFVAGFAGTFVAREFHARTG